MNTFDVLERSARYFPDKPAIIFYRTSFDTVLYKNLREYTSYVGGGLTWLGVKKGDRVAVFLPNCIEYAYIVYACWKVGAIPVLLSSADKGEAIREYLVHFEPKLFVTSNKLWIEAKKAADAPSLRATVCTDAHPEGTVSLSHMLRASDVPTMDLDPNDPALILLTSGTTGRKKGAVLSHGNIISNINAINHHTGMDERDRTICFLPLFHCFGQNFIMNATFNACATLILHERYIPDEVVASVRHHRVTMFFHVPVGYEGLLAREDFKDIMRDRFYSVRYFFSAGAPLSPETAREWHTRIGRRIYIGYGQTEGTPFQTYNSDPECGYRYDTVGSAIENGEIRLVSKKGRIIKDGIRGEVIYRGPNVFLGYYKDPAATRRVLREGWLYTGDIGEFDQGHLRIVDRKTDMVKCGGFAVFPKEIEDRTAEKLKDRISEIAVIGYPDKTHGEIPYAFVVRRDQSLTEADVIAASKSVLAGYAVIRLVRFVDSLPKAPKGTVLKHTLRDMMVREKWEAG